MPSVTAYPTASAVAFLGDVAWVNLSNATGPPDAAFAQVNLSANDASDVMALTGFGFAVSGIVVGIEVTITVGLSNGTLANQIALTKDGTNYATLTEGTLPTSGGPTYLWGATWTPGEINASTFGLFYSCSEFGGSTASRRIESATIKVYTDIPAGVASVDWRRFPNPRLRR